MILECPACQTRYNVPDGAIGPQGRSVRCKNCGHSWHQAPAEPEPEAPAIDLEKPASTEAEVSAPPPEPEAVAPVEEDIQRFDPPEPTPVYDEEPAPRRRWGLVAAIVAAVVLALVAAVFAIGPDRVGAQLGVVAGRPAGSLLLEVPRSPERRQLASGNELFALTGRIVNPTRERQTVPDIQAELQDAQGRVVYSWIITPPARTLAPGATAEFNAAEVDVPKGAQELKLSFVGGARS
jgi:predicted Zn finger-like uncharacterized protein